MKTKVEMDPAAAFPDSKHEPGDAKWRTAFGAAAATFDKVFADLQVAQPAVTTVWQFSPRAGWYQVWLLKKRRLLYLVPKRDDFRVSLILGGKAIAQLKEGPYAKKTGELLKTAKRYPEGTAFSFDRETLDPQLLAAFLAAKIAH